jgi:hypothetical protein
MYSQGMAPRGELGYVKDGRVRLRLANNQVIVTFFSSHHKGLMADWISKLVPQRHEFLVDRGDGIQTSDANASQEGKPLNVMISTPGGVGLFLVIHGVSLCRLVILLDLYKVFEALVFICRIVPRSGRGL